jgi:hypothetical protein
MTEVQERLAPFHSIFSDAHLGAAARLREFAEKVPQAAAALNATERANFLHGQIRDLVGVGVEPADGIHVTNWEVFTVAVDVDLLVRFKYLGQGAPANVATEQQKLLARQQYTDETFALLGDAGITAPPTTVTCGYTMDGMDIGTVTIRRDCKGHESWKYDVYGGETVYEPQLLPTVEEAKPAVVRSRKANREDQTGTGEG